MAENKEELKSLLGLPGSPSGNGHDCQCRRCMRNRFDSGSARSLGGGHEIHSSILAWRLPRTEEPVANSPVQFSSVQSLSRVGLFVTPWIAAHQASLSITNSWSSLRLMSIESVMPSSHRILCCPLLLLPPIPPSIRLFSNESTLCMRWPKYWSFSFSIIPSKEHPGWSHLEWTGWISLQSKGLSRVFSNTTDQKHQFFSAQLSL